MNVTQSVFTKSVIAIVGVSITTLSLISCGNHTNNASSGMDRQACLDSIKASESKLKATVTPDAFTYNKAISNYLRFASSFPTDSMAPACLFDAANISMSLNQYQRAINLYDSVTVKYPAFKRAADCIFIRGFIYDDKLKDTANARKMYQLVIDKYPHDSLASQAKAALAILGKSYDEIIKEFEEKNKNKK
jgi:tetratricopeptide (TPR) repeat protein